jgi:hypothetical protein
MQTESRRGLSRPTVTRTQRALVVAAFSFSYGGSAMDDNRVPPADLSRDFYSRGGQYVTQEQMHAEVMAFRGEMKDGFARLETFIREVRTDAAEAHDRMRQDWQLLLKDSIAHEARLNQGDDERSTLLATAVTRDQFEPVKLLVYGVVGLMLTGVIGALLVLVLRKP